MTVPVNYPMCVLSYGREKVRSHSAVCLGGNIAKFGSFTQFPPIPLDLCHTVSWTLGRLGFGPLGIWALGVWPWGLRPLGVGPLAS